MLVSVLLVAVLITLFSLKTFSLLVIYMYLFIQWPSEIDLRLLFDN